MENKNVYGIYFSPTGTSKKGVLTIAGEFSEQVNIIDMTKLSAKISKSEFDENDIVVFGGHVYSGRLYSEFAEKLRCLKGKNTPCIITVTYGNRDFDDALIEMYDIVKECGFIPFAGGALVAQHTYGEIAIGRPNQNDIDEDIEFANKAKQFQNCQSLLTVKGNRPYRDGGKGHFTPLTNMDVCTNCGFCARECPADAIDPVRSFITDGEKCISCFRCINVCPKQARNMNTEGYKKFAAEFTQKLSIPQKNIY
ncbi:MAG: 4Fe-4S binding protein, partial [Oscillospiraceae bacterium]